MDVNLRRVLAALVDILGEGPTLLGASPWLCDFALNAQLVYLARPPGSSEIVRESARLAPYMERMKQLRATPSNVR